MAKRKTTDDVAPVAKRSKPSPLEVWIVSFTTHEDNCKKRWGDSYEGPFGFESSRDAYNCVEEHQKTWLHNDNDIDVKAIEAKYEAIQEQISVLEIIEFKSVEHEQQIKALDTKLESWEDVFERVNEGEYVDKIFEYHIDKIVVQPSK